MGEVEDQLRRLRMYDQQLEELRGEGFSGYGPVDEFDDEADPKTSRTKKRPSQSSMSIPSTGGVRRAHARARWMELAPVFMGPVDAWSHDVRTRG